MITIEGRKGLKITFFVDNPEEYLEDVSLVGLEGDKLKEALKKPFVVTEDLILMIEYQSESYAFMIPKGYRWNGANVPSFAWAIIGQRTDPRFKLASCIHDYLCENHKYINHNRYLSTLIFETLCEHFGRFNDFKRWLMFHSVDNWQKVCKWRR